MTTQMESCNHKVYFLHFVTSTYFFFAEKPTLAVCLYMVPVEQLFSLCYCTGDRVRVQFVDGDGFTPLKSSGEFMSGFTGFRTS